MSESFIWNPHANQTYDIKDPNEIRSKSFDKDASKSFTMIAPAGSLTLLSSASSTWGATDDATIPPTEINLLHGKLSLRATSKPSEGIDFAMGPYIPKYFSHPLVKCYITNASFEIVNFDTVSAGGFSPPIPGLQIDVNLQLELSGTGHYHVDCQKYLSTKRLVITDRSSLDVHAKEILLSYSRYYVSSESSPANNNLSFNMEAADGEMVLADVGIVFENNAKSLLTSKIFTIRKFVGASAQNNTYTTFATDLVSFYDTSSTAQFTISENSNMVFNTNSGGLPFDFLTERIYPDGLFNLKSNCKGKFTLYGIGNAFQASAMMKKGVISVDEVPQYDRKKLKLDYVKDGNTQNMEISLK